MSWPLSERALILAPTGRDAAVACAMLREAGIRAITCTDVDCLVRDLEGGGGFALVTEEALIGSDLRGLGAWLAAQPEWSDLPFILLTRRGGGLERNPSAQRFLDLLGNVTFLERPFHPTTLISIARSALRGRRRQYEARARLESLAASQRELERANENLEARVDERTRAHETALAQLHEAQKLEMLGQLTGGVAHDFNNLLTPVIGNLDMLRRRGDGDARADRLIDSAMLAASRAATLVQRLLAFARRQDLQPRSVDILDLLDGMRDLIAQSTGPTIAVRIEHPETLPPARVDPNQLELAILNLAINARDAMPGGGEIRIAARAETVAAGGALDPGDYFVLSIADTGTGMDPATLARAIEPFFSTKVLGRGTGLGLSMVHGLAAQLGGMLALKSRPGEGTTAEIWLPVAAEAPARGDGAHAATIAAPRRASVLLVDDEDIVRASTAEMLADMGYDVIEAGSGAEALDLIESGGKVEMLVTDYLMPGMNGVELARRARVLKPKLPVLVISGYSTISEGAGADLPRLAKPFRQPDLARRMADLLDGGAGGSAVVRNVEAAAHS